MFHRKATETIMFETKLNKIVKLHMTKIFIYYSPCQRNKKELGKTTNRSANCLLTM